jgi:hypothetical protein
MVERGLADLGDEVLEPVDIYGPEGTRDLIRSVIQLTFSRVVVPHRIHELKNVPNLMRGKNGQVDSVVVRTRWDPVYGIIIGGSILIYLNFPSVFTNVLRCRREGRFS